MRIASLAFIAIFMLVGATSSPSQAQNLEELLKGTDWSELNPAQKREIEPALEILVCQVIDQRPLLDPSKAYDKASQRVRNCIVAIVRSRDGRLKQKLQNILSQLLSTGTIDIDLREEIAERIKEVLEGSKTPFPTLSLYTNLASAMETFEFLEKSKVRYKTPADYGKLLQELKRALIEYAADPGNLDNRKELGRLAALLKIFAEADQTANIDDLLLALRKLCKKPNVWVHISEDALNRIANKLGGNKLDQIERTDTVNECILGTSIRGTAQIYAKASIALHPAADHAALTFHLDGTAISNTVGYQKPVRIVSKGHSTFWAEKSLSVPDLVTGCATASACTETTICSIKKVGRRILSRLIERIAWKRARQQKSQAEAIAAQKLARKIEKRIDKKLDPIIDIIDRFIDVWLRSPLRGLGLLPDEFKFSTTSEELKVGAAYTRLEQIGAPPGEVPSTSSQSDLTVMIHLDFIRDIRELKRKREVNLDGLVENFLSHLAGAKDDASSRYNLQLFELLKGEKDADKPDSPQVKLLKGKIQELLKQLPYSLEFKDGWLIFQVQLQK